MEGPVLSDRTFAPRKVLLDYAHARACKAFAYGSIEAMRAVIPPDY